MPCSLMALSGMLVSHGALFFEDSIRYASESWVPSSLKALSGMLVSHGCLLH